MNTNTRGEYPPIAILERTRKALSKSASSFDTADSAYGAILSDLADAYIAVWKSERRIAHSNDVSIDFTLPNWVLDVLELNEVVELRS